MKQSTMHIALLALVAGSALFINLGGSLLWDRDEPRNAGCAREMMARNDWVTPVFNAELRDAKPVFLYWAIMSAYQMFGVGEFAARFWSAAAALGTVLCTYRLGRKWFDAETAFIGSLILATSLMFLVAGRAATPDALLIFFTTLSLTLFVEFTIHGTHDQTEQQRITAQGAAAFSLTWWQATAIYVVIGLGVLTKGPLGFLAPMAILGMFQILMRIPRGDDRKPRGDEPAFEFHQILIACCSIAVFVLIETYMGLGFALVSAGVALLVCYIIWRNNWIAALVQPWEPVRFVAAFLSLRPLIGFVVVLAVAGPWYVWVGLRTNGEFLSGFLLDENFGRATTSFENHGGNVLYYPAAILLGFFPWSIFAIPSVIDWIKRLRNNSPDQTAAMFLLCWAGVFIGVFSLCQTKLPSYITPCFPALALLTGRFLAHWRRGNAFFSNNWMKVSTSVLGLVGVAMLIAIPIFAQRIFNEVSPTAWLVAATPIVGAMIAGGCIWFNSRRSLLITYGATAGVMAILIFAIAAPEVSSKQQCRRLLAEIDQQSDRPRVAAIRNLEPSWVFYSRRPIELFTYDEGKEVGDFLTGEDTFLIVAKTDFDRIRNELPEDAKVVAQTDYFLKSTPLLLVRGNQRLNVADSSHREGRGGSNERR